MAKPTTKPQTDSPDSITTTQSGFPAHARPQCRRFAQLLYPSPTLREAPSQGHCSYTLLLNPTTIIQFRPPQHALDLAIADAAHNTFGALAPQTTLLGPVPISSPSQSNRDPQQPVLLLLLAYTQTLLPGIPLSTHPLPTPYHSLIPLIRSLAHSYFARSFKTALPPTSAHLPGLKRRVGRTLRERVQMLQVQLPARFQGVVGRVGRGLEGVEKGLPWGLTHGDFGGGNILVLQDQHSDCGYGDGSGPGDGQGKGGDGGRQGGDHTKGGGGESKGEGRLGLSLGGLVDWAEGEYLPFGVGLYGLESVLGRVSETSGRFEYYPCADELRRVFWEELEGAVPELVRDKGLRARVEDARLLGLLLWHGFAFDDGAINRVVCAGRDDEELQKLDLFLLGREHDGDAGTPSMPDGTLSSDTAADYHFTRPSRQLNFAGGNGRACSMSAKL